MFISYTHSYQYSVPSQQLMAIAYPTPTPLASMIQSPTIQVMKSVVLLVTITYWIIGCLLLSVFMNDPKSALWSLAPQINNKRTYLAYTLVVLLIFPIFALAWPALIIVECFRDGKQRKEEGIENPEAAHLLDDSSFPLPYTDDEEPQTWNNN